MLQPCLQRFYGTLGIIPSALLPGGYSDNSPVYEYGTDQLRVAFTIPESAQLVSRRACGPFIVLHWGRAALVRGMNAYPFPLPISHGIPSMHRVFSPVLAVLDLLMPAELASGGIGARLLSQPPGLPHWTCFRHCGRHRGDLGPAAAAHTTLDRSAVSEPNNTMLVIPLSL
jgi:hypothetical protein